MTDERMPSAAQVDAWQRETLSVPADAADADQFPRMLNLSAGPMFRAVLRPDVPERPEFVTMPIRSTADRDAVVVAEWNSLWEAAQYRRRFFNLDELPPMLAKIADAGDVNAIVVPRTRSRYYEYAPLMHLLPASTLQRFGLPLLRSGQWPFSVQTVDYDRYLPADFENRLARAWAWHVWPHLNSGSRASAFSEQEPIRLLAHNLDFWLPPVTQVIQEKLGTFPEVGVEAEPGPVMLEDGTILEGAHAGRPRMGGDVWRGSDEAAEALGRTIDAADRTGHLRGILDAVRSHRVADDFSPYWSRAREDFERKLYNKRAKVRVRFVELTDTIAVQGPESEVVGDMVTNDFLALLDRKDREIVILLNSGTTRLAEIASLLGYANHSAVSKRLAGIRRQAAAFFSETE